MPIFDISNPRVIDFLLENYEKESRMRMKWVNLHKEKIYQAATPTRELKNYTQNYINKSLMVAGMPTVTRDYAVAARHRFTKPVRDHMLVKSGVDKDEKPSMIPVKKEVQDLIKESRQEYLKARKCAAPEDKYNFVESSNWAYGWRMGDSELKLRGAVHGRVCHMLHNMRSRVGPQRDPDYYAAPDVSRTFCER